jgi:MoaA/NifB/PqqE/SkfB family radical SAM enzyme
MNEIIDFVSGLKNIKTHTKSLVRENLAAAHYKKVDYHKYHQAIERLERNLKNTFSSIYPFKGARVKAAQDKVQRRLIYQTACEQKRIIPSYAGRLNLILHESGDIYPCEMLNESFGNIRQYGYNAGRVMRSEKALKIIDAIRANQCYCTHECYSMTNFLFNPKLYLRNIFK